MGGFRLLSLHYILSSYTLTFIFSDSLEVSFMGSSSSQATPFLKVFIRDGLPKACARPSERSPLFRWIPQPRQIEAGSPYWHWLPGNAKFGQPPCRCQHDTLQANHRFVTCSYCCSRHSFAVGMCVEPVSTSARTDGPSTKKADVNQTLNSFRSAGASP
jgi:hypothetical protein